MRKKKKLKQEIRSFDILFETYIGSEENLLKFGKAYYYVWGFIYLYIYSSYFLFIYSIHICFLKAYDLKCFSYKIYYYDIPYYFLSLRDLHISISIWVTTSLQNPSQYSGKSQ